MKEFLFGLVLSGSFVLSATAATPSCKTRPPLTKQAGVHQKATELGADMEKLLDQFSDIVAYAVMAAWIYGSVLGVVYWAVFGQITHSVFSLIVPLFGAATVTMDLYSSLVQ